MPELEPRYLRAIGEYADHELLRELHERSRRRHLGVCDYCGLAGDEQPCQFPERHRLAATRAELAAGGREDG